MASSSRPAWLVEALDVLDRRASLLRGVVLAVVLLGVLLAFVAPGVVPPQPLVGAAVAVVAILLGVAVTLAVDAGDGTVRGTRHVAAAGGELVGVLPTRVTSAATGDLAESVLDARDGRRVVLGVAATSEGVDVSAWTDALGVSLAARHASVLVVDLVAGATPQDGLVEVVFEDVSLGHSVTFERDVKLARLGAGRDLDRAIAAAAQLPTRLPKDLEVLLLALPPVVDPEVINAVEALDAVLLVARSDATPRVRLQAAIEAVRTVGTTAQVVLIDDALATNPRPTAPSAPTRDRAPDGDDRAEVDPERPAGDRDPSDRRELDPVARGSASTEPGQPRALDPGAAARVTTAEVGAVIAAGADGRSVDADADGGASEPAPRTPASDSASASADDADDAAAAPVVAPAADAVSGATPASSAAGPDPSPEPAGTEPGPDPSPRATAPAEATAPEAPQSPPDPAAPSGATPGRRSITGRDVTATTGQDPEDDPWTRPRTTPREELERRPSPSVRVVRDLPPSARSPRPGFADQAPPLPPAPTAASPRDPDLVAGAAAAGLAARLSGPEPAAAPAPPQEVDAATGDRPAADEAVEPDAPDEPDTPDAVVEVGSPPEPEVLVVPEVEREPEPDEVPEPEVLATPEVEREPQPEVAADPAPEHVVAADPAPEHVVAADPAPEPEVAADPAPEPEVAADPAPVVVDEDDEVVDPTDEIPAVRDARLARTAPEDDPLRTTAQLAMLMDELHGRDDEDDPSAP